MARARFAVLAAMLVVLLLGGVAGPPGALRFAGVPVAAVAWPPSSGLVVAEVVTGGASASDEYVELANASATAIAGTTSPAWRSERRVNGTGAIMPRPAVSSLVSRC